MIKLGITGTIGSGKTIVSSIFETIGIPVYNADIRAKQLMTNSKKIVSAMKNRFGFEVYINGNINKPFLANIIFNNEGDRKFINSIVHPEVIEDFIKWAFKQQNTEIVAIESALIYESGIDKLMNYTIIVKSPNALASKRISKRDSISKEEAEKKINLQMQNLPNNIKPDFLIKNDEKNSLIEQCLEVFNKIKSNHG